jgi:molecular chaperone GrpE
MEKKAKAEAHDKTCPAAGSKANVGAADNAGAEATNQAATAAPEKAAPAADAELPASTPPPTPEQIAELKERAAKADDHWQRFLYLAADFDNYKKRAARERQDAVTYANEAMLKNLIPTLDAFEMALTAAKPDPSSQSLREGILMVSNQLKATLAQAGLEEIIATSGEFDPNCQEALSQQENADVPEGRILLQVRKGYKFRNRLIRPAGVIVAKKPAA